LRCKAMPKYFHNDTFVLWLFSTRYKDLFRQV